VVVGAPVSGAGVDRFKHAVRPHRWRWTVHADTARLLAAGAIVPEPGVLLDPQGNEFSVTE
jgi:hypothetical protein